MTDDQIEQSIRDLISENMDEENRKAALEWLDKLTDTYQVMLELGLMTNRIESAAPTGNLISRFERVV